MPPCLSSTFPTTKSHYLFLVHDRNNLHVVVHFAEQTFLVGQQHRTISFPQAVLDYAEKNDFELQGYIFEAEKEQLRQERKVRLGLIQNSIVSPTTDPVDVQRNAIHKKIETILFAASQSGVNVVCFQEAWSEYSHQDIW